MSIPEQDWEILRHLKDQKLNAKCGATVEKVKAVIKNGGQDAYKTYINMWSLLNKEDEEISGLFDDLKRNTAIQKLAAWQNHGLLSETELNKFSSKTKEGIVAITNTKTKAD